MLWGGAAAEGNVWGELWVREGRQRCSKKYRGEEGVWGCGDGVVSEPAGCMWVKEEDAVE